MAGERAGEFDHGSDHAAGAPIEGVDRPAVGKQTLVDGWMRQVEATGGWARPAQKKAHGAVDAAAGPPPSSGGGVPLPADLVGKLEHALGGSFAAVRVHEHSYASAIGALAFARGTDLYFAPGAYDPKSPRGLELLGHELTHVVQQQQGRVPATSEVGGAPLNDDAGLEAEADAMGAKVAKEVAPGGGGGDAAPSKGGAAAAAGPVQKKEDPAAARDASALTCEEVAPAAAPTAGGAPIQRAPGPKQTEPMVPFYLTITKPMTRQEVADAASMQFFGVTLKDWTGGKPNYTAADSPIKVLFSQSLVQKYRGAASAQKGIATTKDGAVEGADDRAKDFAKDPQRSALIDEIDRRYAAATGSGAKIKPGEVGQSKLWTQIRDEVLFQREHLGNLPPGVQAVIKMGIDGKVLTPADYDQLFRIAKKLEGLPPGAVADYTAKVTGKTQDLNTLEDAVAKYQTDLDARQKQDAERTKIGNALGGLEEVYKLYRSYKKVLTSEAMTAGAQSNAPPGMPVIIAPDYSGMLRTQLNEQLPRFGFANIAAFEDHIKKYEQAFTEGAATLTLELLAKYNGKLFQEQERYANPAVVKDLHGKLAPFREQAADVQKQNGIIADEQRDRSSRDNSRLPGNGGTAPPPSAREEAAKAQATKSFAAAKQSIAGLAKEYPIFSEDELPVDKRVNKQALANASEAQLGPLLLAHIGERQSAAVEARKEVEGNHDVIFKMDKLMPMFFTSLDVQAGSVHEMIIQDKMSDGAIKKIVVGVLLAVAAIALTIISMGAATPAVIAAGASIGAAGLSTYMAYDEYKTYATDKHLADAGFADDPHVIWLVLAIVGAGVDMAAATKAVGKLASAASKFAQGTSELSDFQKAVAALREANEIDAKIASAADKAAEAREAYKTAKDGLKAAMAGKLYSFPGPLGDYEVWKSVVQMALAKMRQGGHSFISFLAELNKLRLEAKLGELAPEEVGKARLAWEEAERQLAVAARIESKVTDAAQLARLRTLVTDADQLERLLAKIADAAQLEKLLGKAGGPANLEKLLGVFDVAKIEAIFAKITNPEKLAGLIDAIGPESARQLVEKTIASTKPKDVKKLTDMLDRLSKGSAQLADQGGLKAGSVVVDSNVIIGDTKIKAGDPTAHAGDAARVKFLEDHAKTGGDVHVGNMTTAETDVTKVGPNNVAAKGLPLEVSRESQEYKDMLAELKRLNIGDKKGIQDQQLVADILFAKRDAGVMPEFGCGDRLVYEPLAEKMGIPVPTTPPLLSETQKAGFIVDVLGRKMKVYPLP